jgi:RluA family pseudouridine synthase
MPQTITNIAAYLFAELSQLKELRARLLALCKQEGLKGTILLSTEGINLFVAGGKAEIDILLAALRSVPGLEKLTPKCSESKDQPFSRMLVRIKKEIIAFGVDGINPARRTSPKLAASTLKQWLDEGRRVHLLDTRNDYEIKLGTFRGAIPAGIDHFREFPQAVEKLPASMKDEPIVMFCTGGIRCEKAGPFMEQVGYRQIFQLDGGILKYFEECSGDHYDGECFVFDQRVGVDPALRETAASQCFQCLTPLSGEDQEDPRYVTGKSCSYCFKTPAEQMSERILSLEASIRRACDPLAGSLAYDNFRPITIPLEQDGASLLETLASIFPQTPQVEWATLISAGLLLDSKYDAVAVDCIVRAGERYLRKLPATIEPDVNAEIGILYEDEALIVVDKPAPLPLHPSGRFNRNTLQSILQAACHPLKPRPAHRLDANTTGLVIFSKTRHFAKFLQPQFERGEVEKIYLARVQGRPDEDTFSCDAPISDSPGEAGSRGVDLINGLPARTDFRVLNRFSDNSTLIEARPLTGRTNQIRVHLWHMGFPICGDPLYLANGQLGARQTLSPDEPPLCLHAWKLSFTHPLDHTKRTFEAPLAKWAKDI